MSQVLSPSPAHAAALLEWLDSQAAGGVFSTDRDLVIRSWNRWMTVATGVPQEGALGRNLFEILPSIVERGLAGRYDDALKGEVMTLAQVLHGYLVPCQRPSGEMMPQRSRIGPLLSGNEVIGTVTVVEDVGERVASDRQLRQQIAAAEAAREEAEAASRAKDEFLATLSHEIRTPLSAVLGWVHLLKVREPDAATIKRAVEVIERNAQAQLTLISDMLDMARISAGKVRLDFADIDMTAVVTAAIDAVRPAADAKGVRLVTDLKAGKAAVSGDGDRLQQVVWNILSNAVKFTGAGGLVVTTLRADLSGVHLSVADTGEGIDPKFLAKVFERFRQADTSAARRAGGLGLGLALVKDLVTMHGGRVEVESPGVGLGSTFSVHLPLRQTGASSTVSRQAATPAGTELNGIKVLIVEDDPDAREIATQSIFDAGGSAVAVASASEALKALVSGECKPDALVSDIGLPGTDGYALLRDVRNLPKERGGTVPAIAVTAYASDADALRALQHGFVSHLTKPYVPSHLVAAVHRAVHP